MGKEFIDYFQWLEVHFMASDEIIKAAYRKLSQKYHPDNNGDQWQLLRVNEAYSVLGNPESKKVYMDSYARYFGKEELLNKTPFDRSMYDFTVQPIRRVLIEYLYLIQNGELDAAYQMLSDYNRKHIFKKDFVEWQRLIAGIHELKEFDGTYLDSGTIQFSEDKLLRNKKFTKFRVKVIEKNHLLNKAEEDYFDRLLVLDEDGWHILLNQIHIKKVIKKYRKLTDVYNRHSHPLILERNGREFSYSTGYVTRKSFLNNCEHEQLRYQRYQSAYSVIGFLVEKAGPLEQLKEVLETNTRVLDSFTYLKRGIFLILLPETAENKGLQARKKLLKMCSDAGLEVLINSSRCVEQQYESVKELLNEVMK